MSSGPKNLSYGFRVREVPNSPEEEGYPERGGYRRDESRLDGEEESEGYRPYHTSADATRRYAPESRP